MTRPPPLGQRYAFVVAAIAFIILLAAAGRAATPGVLLQPLQRTEGWDGPTISLAAAVGIFLFGLTGPFAGSLMQKVGVRRTVLWALAMMAVAMGLSTLTTNAWHLVLTWGVLGGVASGCLAMVFAAIITNRWFVKNRGLVSGLLTASISTGQLVFLPILAAVSTDLGWRPAVWVVTAAVAAVIPLAFFLLPETPADIGLLPYGATEPPSPPQASAGNPVAHTFSVLGRAARVPNFWLLFATFFVCGLTTNGLVGVHMISLCADYGLVAVQAAWLVAAMGVFDIVGTTGSGWRKLLFVYYSLRGLSLVYLPFSDFSLVSLSVFAAFYGLDWIATVPPTLRLTTETFGERDAPIVFGWIAAGHQLGAATAAFGAGALRAATGRYLEAFVIAGITAVAASLLALAIRRQTPRLAA
jgi:predicted MFS family arabinose efflux permease